MGFVIPVYGTGLNADRSLATLGAKERYWLLTASADPSHTTSYVCSTLDPFWTNGQFQIPTFNNSDSQWIAPDANADQNFAVGNYTYQHAFDLTGFAPSTASIIGSLRSCDDTAALYLNGTLMFSITSSQIPHPFTLSSGFIAGVNTLQVVIFNQSSAFPQGTGWIMEITATSAQPNLMFDRSGGSHDSTSNLMI